MNTRKYYPLRDGHRRHFVRHPILITEEIAQKKPCAIPLKPGKWMAVDVLLPNGYNYLIGPGMFETEEACQKACDCHNRYHGWTEEVVKEIISKSMGLKTNFTNKNRGQGTEHKHAMKKGLTILAAALMFIFSSCNNPPEGTSHRLDNGKGKIEVYRYYYDGSGNWVYVSRFKDQPGTSTTTWLERHGKQWYQKASIFTQ